LLRYRSTSRQERVAYESPEYPHQDPFATPKELIREIADGEGYDALGLLALLIQLLRDPSFPFFDAVTAWGAV
jgi:hypothetical protein